MPKKKTENKSDAEVINEVFRLSNNPTSLTDIVNVAFRQDGSIMLSLMSVLPEHAAIENHRTVLNPDTVKSLINILCEVTGHYPPKPRPKRAEKKK